MSWRLAQAYNQDLWERILPAADAGAAVGRVASMLSLNASYVPKVLSCRRLARPG
jgi:hypothetical protein